MDDGTPKRGASERIKRLRRRLVQAKAYGASKELVDVIKGILDLLEDEL